LIKNYNINNIIFEKQINIKTQITKLLKKLIKFKNIKNKINLKNLKQQNYLKE
jgi:hypothetical protein